MPYHQTERGSLSGQPSKQHWLLGLLAAWLILCWVSDSMAQPTTHTTQKNPTTPPPPNSQPTQPQARKATSRKSATLQVRSPFKQMWRWLPPEAPLWVSFRPHTIDKVFKILPVMAMLLRKHQTSPPATKTCQWMMSLTGFLAKKNLKHKHFATECARSINTKKRVLWAPFVTKGDRLDRLFRLGSLPPKEILSLHKDIGVRLLTWLLPADNTPKMQRAWATLLAQLGMRPWKQPLSSLPQGTQSFAGANRVALLILRQGFLQVLLAHAPPPKVKVQQNAWRSKAWNALRGLLQEQQTQQPRMTLAKAHFLQTSGDASLYIHRKHTLREGTVLGLFEAITMLPRATESQRLSIAARYLHIAMSSGFLMRTPAADAEDAAWTLSFKNGTSLRFAQTLTAKGKAALQKATPSSHKTFAVRPGNFTLDISSHFNVAAWLRHFHHSFPWLSLPTNLQLSGTKNTKELYQTFRDCGLACSIPAALAGFGHLLGAFHQLSPTLQQNTSLLPLRMRVVAFPSQKNALPTAALIGEWNSKDINRLTPWLNALKRQTKGQLSYHTQKMGKTQARACLMIGLQVDPRKVFKNCKLIPTRENAFIRAKLYNFKLLRTALDFARNMYSSTRTGSTHLKSPISTAIWHHKHGLFGVIRQCPNKGPCKPITQPDIPAHTAAPLPLPRHPLPANHPQRCFQRASFQAYELNLQFDTVNRKKLPEIINTRIRYWKRMRSCMRKDPTLRPWAKAFKQIGEGFLNYIKQYRLHKKDKDKFVLSSVYGQMTFSKQDVLHVKAAPPSPPGTRPRLGLTLVFKPKGVTIATRGSLQPRGCPLRLSPRQRAIPFEQRLTCPHQDGKPDHACIIKCIDKIKAIFPKEKDLYLFVTSPLRATYTTSLTKGQPSPLLTFLLNLKQKQDKKRQSFRYILVDKLHDVPGRSWLYIFRPAFRNKRIRRRKPAR